MAEIILNKVLKKLIEERHTSVRTLAKDTGIPQSTLNAMALGREPGRVDHLVRLAKFFGVSIDYLLMGKDERPPTFSDVLTEDMFEGWLKVKIERAIPNKKKREFKNEEDK